MLNIAFCDDELSVLNGLRVLVEQYRVFQGLEMEYTAYSSPLELLSVMERGVRYDILFLDVLMPGENGIETAREIRGWDQSVKIIFLTSSAEFAVQSYAVGAYFYQLKPIWEESFFRLMDNLVSELAKAEADNLILKCKSGITRVHLDHLEYCEVIGRSLLLHLNSGKVLESVGRMDDLSEKLLPYGNFLRPHRSYLVNMDYIQNISSRAITLSCLAGIPVPRGKYTELKNTFLEYAFRENKVTI